MNLKNLDRIFSTIITLWKIVLSADIDKDDCVIEIGPGLGVMTSYLAERANRLLPWKLTKLIPVLEHLKEDYENIEIVNEDVLKLDINKKLLKILL